MREAIVPILMAIGGGVIYHMSSKSIPKSVNPFIALIVAYVTALLVCIGGLFFTTGQPPWNNLKEVNWASFGIGVGVATVEVGFILAYRAGSRLGLTSFMVNVSVTIILLIIGFLVLKETITSANIIGFVLCIIGLALIANR